jgi:short-subunit dehydrogenase
MLWKDATVVVSGASRGIGKAIATAATERGARLALVARSAATLATVRDELGGQPVVVAADLADARERARALDTVQQALGPIDILVNNAGTGSWGPFVEMPEDEMTRIVALNLVGTLDLTRRVLPEMIRRRRGHVVNVGSVAGRLGAPFEAVYSASKFGLAGFTEALAIELRPFGVGVSMVNPGPVSTEFAAASGGQGYARRRPRAIPPERVAAVVITAVERGGLERVVPRWLRVAHGVRTLLPVAYEVGARRAVAAQLASFERRWASE